MDFNVDTIWGILKADLLEEVWVMTIMFALSDIVKHVPPLEMMLVR